MYEASFGLKRRPFAATPDATCFLSSGPIQAALDELVVCIEHGQGIGILTAPAGTGKTLLCERLRLELGERFETVFLRHASFLTRRALLQTILCELNHAYHHPSEQELRLELLPAIRGLTPKRDALVLICDEAHQLSDSLLEELRILADFAESGRPLVRLVLSGQLSLEEKLAQSSLEAFNQRIRAQVCLSPFDRAASLDYIDYRLTWAGGRTDEVFTPAALDVIAKASDGIPRCINQLADHTLLLAFVAEQKPAGEELVREALSDLRQLPLHWNEPASSTSVVSRSMQTVEFSNSVSDSTSHHVEFSSILKDLNESPVGERDLPVERTAESIEWSSVEFDAAIPDAIKHAVARLESATPAYVNRIEAASDDWRQTVESFDPGSRSTSFASTATNPPLPSSLETDDRFHSSLTRRMHFDDLLQDAYAAAGQSVASFTETETLPRADRMELVNRYEPLAEHPLEDRRAIRLENLETLTDPFAHSLSRKPQVYEEVILDRYASIDAGFAPPESVASDTEAVNQVQAAPTDSEEFSELESSETVIPDCLTEHGDATSEPNLECHDGHESECDEHHLDSSSSVTESEFVEAERGGELISEEQTSISDLSLPLPMISDPISDDDLVDEHSLAVTAEEDSSHKLLSFSDGDSTASSADGIEQIANEVYSIGQSLEPTGALSSNSQSILTALRREMSELSYESSHEHIEPTISVQPIETWESIETTEVPVVAETRPYRYLFSMLRRKQQGLA